MNELKPCRMSLTKRPCRNPDHHEPESEGVVVAARAVIAAWDRWHGSDAGAVKVEIENSRECLKYTAHFPNGGEPYISIGTSVLGWLLPIPKDGN